MTDWAGVSFLRRTVVHGVSPGNCLMFVFNITMLIPMISNQRIYSSAMLHNPIGYCNPQGRCQGWVMQGACCFPATCLWKLGQQVHSLLHGYFIRTQTTTRMSSTVIGRNSRISTGSLLLIWALLLLTHFCNRPRLLRILTSQFT
jgi:hypothetical protein